MGDQVETYVEPDDPDTDDGGDSRSLRIAAHAYDGIDHFDAGVQLFGDDVDDPDRFAEVLLAAALALASLRGPDCGWAAIQRFAAYDGTAGGAHSG